MVNHWILTYSVIARREETKFETVNRTLKLVIFRSIFIFFMFRRVLFTLKVTNSFFCSLCIYALYQIHTARYIFMRVDLLRWNDVPRTSRFSCPKIAIFSRFQVCLSVHPGAKQIINLLLLGNFYSKLVISYRVQKFKKKTTNYCVQFTRYGPRNGLLNARQIVI